MSEEIIRCRDVIAGLIPEVGKAEQRPVQEENRREDQRKYVDTTKTDGI